MLRVLLVSYILFSIIIRIEHTNDDEYLLLRVRKTNLPESPQNRLHVSPKPFSWVDAEERNYLANLNYHLVVLLWSI